MENYVTECKVEINQNTREILGNIWERGHHDGGTCSGFENSSGFISLNRGSTTKQLSLGHYQKQLTVIKGNELANLEIKHIRENKK